MAVQGHPEPRRTLRRLLNRLMVTLLALSIACAAVGALFLASLPSVTDAQARTTQVLSDHGGMDTGLPLPDKFTQAIVATEDRRFYEHPGVDPVSLVKAAWDTATKGAPRGGATIAQQLAKNLYVPDDESIITKLDQIGMGVKLEISYSKEQILQMYIDAIYYGDGQWGIVQASQHYFGKNPDELDWAEASLLAGLPQAPSAYAPTTHFNLAKQRQRRVLDALVTAGKLTAVQADEAYAETLAVGR